MQLSCKLLLFLSLISYSCFGQCEYLLHKSYAERYQSLDSLFIDTSFLYMDSIEAYHRIHTIREMATNADDEELVLETKLGEYSYWLNNDLNRKKIM